MCTVLRGTRGGLNKVMADGAHGAKGEYCNEWARGGRWATGGRGSVAWLVTRVLVLQRALQPAARLSLLLWCCSSPPPNTIPASDSHHQCRAAAYMYSRSGTSLARRASSR